MKRVRLFIVFLLGFFAFVCFLSYISGLEIGKGSAWLILAGLVSAGGCYLLARHWSEHDKLPDEVQDRDNDNA